MNQTPAHDAPNPDLLRVIPTDARRLVEAGCSTGAMARAYRSRNNDCVYAGIEIDATYAKKAESSCDRVIVTSLDELNDAHLDSLLQTDCWIFGDVLEHLADPWRLLDRLHRTFSKTGCIAACIPNMQHWSIQLKLNSGALQYEPIGLLDRTHLRWFTRTTIVELFESTGYTITSLTPRIFNRPSYEKKLSAIRAAAIAFGNDPDLAESDARPLQYVVTAVPTRA